ncbi:hypothetical protein D3C86_1259290 [compost metagenome]
MTDQQHGNEHDQVAQEYRPHGLSPGHTAVDQAGRQRVGGDAHDHAQPQCCEVIPAPRPLSGGGRRQVAVPKLARPLRVIARHECAFLIREIREA